MQFGFIASTGRTATTFIASALNKLPEVVGSHEGYLGNDKLSDPILPLINLENNQAFQKRSLAEEVVKAKRNLSILEEAALANNAQHLFDVAYYNPVIAEALLAHDSEFKFVGIIRDCESFVRSATAISGEDLLPVGWPDADKPLSTREKFIALGRLRPRKDSKDFHAWKTYSAIEKNIWLWRETNLLLLEAVKADPNRATIFNFATIKEEGPNNLLWQIGEFFGLSAEALWRAGQSLAESTINKKSSGYQIGNSDKWTISEKEMLANAEAIINIG